MPRSGPASLAARLGPSHIALSIACRPHPEDPCAAAQAGQLKNPLGEQHQQFKYLNADGGKKGKGREGVGVGRKQAPDTTF